MLSKGHGGLFKAPTRKKEENERLRGGRDQIKFLILDLKDICRKYNRS